MEGRAATGTHRHEARVWVNDLDERALEKLVAIEGKVPDEPAYSSPNQAVPVGGNKLLHFQPVYLGGDTLLAQPLALCLVAGARLDKCMHQRFLSKVRHPDAAAWQCN